uniref:RUN domain-containing protein n=1 Tax=Rodentolepis nana TaxID=102285 RepID=A0A0R3TFD2_RODNA
LMQADMKTVEGLYNSAVDLDRLNSAQVRYILRAYRPSYARSLRHLKDASSITTGSTSECISVQWIDFIISGVTQVSDRLLSEESEQSDWKPQLLEPLDLRLPILLPDDCYPSSTRIRNPHLESNTESSHECQTDPDNSSLKSQSGAVEVSELSNYLQPALLSGWCRLSFRQNPNLRSEPWLSWDVYLAAENVSSSNEKVSNLSVDVDSPSRDSPGPKTPPACEPPLPPVPKPIELINTDSPVQESTTELDSANLSDSTKVDDSSSIRIFSVAVPKIGNNLGLSIIAARTFVLLICAL